MKEFTEQLKRQAEALGFVLNGVALAAMPGRLQQFHAWLDSGRAAEMHYFEERRQAYQHPRHVLDGCKSLLMLGLPYLTQPQQKSRSEAQPGRGLVARYAQGAEDYHDVIYSRLKELIQWTRARHPHAKLRGVVDTAPLLEREMAELAGLGWVGKNTLLLNQRWGSYFFLAALLTDLDLSPDEPSTSGHCGTCTACLDACPTHAFPTAYVLDARRCISYLTIEHRGEIADDLAEQLCGWAFGCDICQEVCPWNRKSALASEVPFEPQEEFKSLNILQILAMDEADFRDRFRRTPLWRPRRRGVLRNAILIAGQQGMVSAVPRLRELSSDPEPLIRGAAAWALARLKESDSA